MNRALRRCATGGALLLMTWLWLGLPSAVTAQDGGVSDLQGGDGSIGEVPSAVGPPPRGARLKAGHIMLSPVAPDLLVTEVYVLDVSEGFNPTDGDESQGSLSIPLPPEAREAKVLRGGEQWRLAPEGREATLAGALERGQHTLALSYRLAAAEERLMVNRRLPLAADSFSVIWPERAGFSVQAMGFSDQGTVTMGPRRMRLLERQEMAPGQRIVIVVTPGDQPEDQPPPGRTRQVSRDPLGELKWFTLALAGLLLLGGLVFPWSSRGSSGG